MKLMGSFGSGSSLLGFANLFRSFNVFKKSGSMTLAMPALTNALNIMNHLDGAAVPIDKLTKAMIGLDAASAGTISGLIGLDKATVNVLAGQLGLSPAAMSSAAAVAASGTAASGAAGAFSAFGAAIANAARGLAAFLLTNPIGWAIMAAAAIAGVVAVVKKYNEHQAELRQKAIDAGNAAQEEAQKVSDLYLSYQKTYDQYKNGVASKEELKSATDSLCESLGKEGDSVKQLSGSYDELSGILSKKVASNLIGNISEMHSGLIAQEKEIGSKIRTYTAGQTYSAKNNYVNGDLGKYLEDTIGRNYINRIFPQDYSENVTFDRAKKVYEQYQAFEQEIINGIENGAITQEDVDKNKSWQKIVSIFSEYETLFQERAEKIKSINDTTALVQYSNLIQTNGLPKTQKEFIELTKSIEEAGVANGRFAGSEEDINAAIMDLMARIPQLSDFYEQWVLDTGIDDIKNSFGAYLNHDSRLVEFSKFDKWINELSDDDKRLVYSISLNTDTAMFSLEDWVNALEDAKNRSETVAEKITVSLRKAINSTADVLTAIGAANDVLGKQNQGTSISIEDYNSDDLKDYRDALEYVNGVYQLNIDKVHEISKAKAEEQIAINNVEKAISQSNYLENAKKIEKLRREISEYTDAESNFKELKQTELDALIAENESISNTITQYNLLSASLKEATGAYQMWLAAQSTPNQGDMFRGVTSEIDLIEEVHEDENGGFKRTNTDDYKSAVNDLVPETISKQGEEAIHNYVQQLKQYFKKDAEGNLTGEIDIGTFLGEAVKSGQMNFDAVTGEYKLAGQMSMEQFAEGMGLSVPFVQKAFGMLSEYDGLEFQWIDDVSESLMDLAVKATDAAESLRQIDGIDSSKINVDIGDFDVTKPEEAKQAVERLGETIEYLSTISGELNLDDSQIEEANSVIAYCITQKQLLEEPAFMKVDTSQITGDVKEAIELLQNYQTAVNNLEKVEAKIGANAEEVDAAKKEVDDALAAIDKSKAFATVGLKIDDSSKESLQTSLDTVIGSLSTTEGLKLKLGINDSAIKEWSCDPKEADVIFTPSDPEVKAYEATEEKKKGTVIWNNDTQLVSTYAARVQTAKGIVYWTNDTSKVRTSFTATGKVNGTAQLSGTAKAGGDWRDKTGGKTLVGELGTEIVVDPRTGKWYTVGDSGAEFVDIPKGAIVFNHKQSESLLKYGYVTGRAHALVNGTANGDALAGGRVEKTIAPATTTVITVAKYKNPENGNKVLKNITSDFHIDPIISDEELEEATKSSTNSASEKEPEKYDWIEIAINRIEQAIDRISKKAESAFKKISTRLAASKDEISDITKEIAIQQKAYNRYMQEAEYVGLDEDLVLLVKNGTIDIDEYDEETQKQINDYKNWYEKALDCRDAVDDLHESIAELYEDNFNNVKTDYDNQLGLLEHSINTYQSGIDMIQQKGYLASAKYYESSADLQRQNISILQNELNDLNVQFQNAMSSGEIEEYSEAWYGFQNEINGVKEAIADANTEMLTLADSMRDAEWGVFDYTSGMITRLNDEASFLIDLMSDYNLHEDNGAITDKGMATMGLRGMNYNVYMAQANRYGDEVKRLNKLLKDDPYNTNYISRREEVLKLQRDSIKAAQEQKVAITDFVKDGIDKELESLQDLIDKYEDSLDAAKNLNDYQEKISDQAKEVASLRKQLTAYSGDESEEGRARLQKIQTQLEQAEKELAKTEYDQYISDQKDMLNELYETYEETLNKRVDDIDRVLEEQTDVINANAEQISDTINGFAESMGYTVTNEMGEIWNKNTIAASFDGVMAKYDKDYSTQLTSINTTLSFIDNWVRLATSNTEKTYDAIIDTDNMMIDPNAHQTLRSNGVKAYKGGGLVDYTGIAKVDGSASRPEMVLDSEDTRNFISLRNSLRNIASRPLTMSSIGISGSVPVGGIRDISDRLSAISAMTYNTGYTFGDFEINIPIDHVEDYNDLVRQLQKDKQFEEMVLDMTVNRVMGKSSLAKNKHKW